MVDSNIDSDPYKFRLGIANIKSNQYLRMPYNYYFIYHCYYIFFLNLSLLSTGAGIVLQGWDVGLEGNFLYDFWHCFRLVLYLVEGKYRL